MSKHGNMEDLRACVYGAAVGDALGVPYEFRARGAFECTGMASGGAHNQPVGTFSDDTSMLLATCDSLRANSERVDIEDMRERFRAWAFEGVYAVDGVVFDIGGTTSTALHSGVGSSGERSNGNGSLMRIAPLAFTDASDDEIRDVSAITHAHEISMQACVHYVHILRGLLHGDSLSIALAQALAKTGGSPLERASSAASWSREEVRSGGYVLDTLAASIWCLANTKSYAECVIAAVNLGDDTDTTACIAGALAGVVYGFDAIPAEWLEVLRGKDIIERCLFAV